MTELNKWFRRLPVVAVISLLGFWVWRCSPWSLHRRINPGDVARVELRAKGSSTRATASDDESRQIIRWFNAAGSIRDNSHHGAPGCGDYNYVYILLKSGEQIHISSYDRVTRHKHPQDEEYTDYYFTQPDLHQYLQTLDKRLSSTASSGC